MISQNKILLPGSNDAITRIKKYMSNSESGIVLTPNEEKILSRLMFANGLLAEKKFTRDQIAEKIKSHFSVSVHTARADINNTYTLFAAVTADYKRYTLIHHIEFIDQKILAWQFDKSLAPFLPKLIEAKTRAVQALEVLPVEPDTPQPLIFINVTGKPIPSDVAIDQAREEADAIIAMEEKIVDEYLDFEEQDNKGRGNE